MSFEDRKNAPPLRAKQLGPSRGVLKVAHVPPGQFHHARIAPPASVASLIQHFWTVRWRMEEGATHVAQTLPYPNVHWVFENHEAIVYGIHRGRFTRELIGEDGVFGVKFRPGGFYPFFKRSVSTLRNRGIRLEAVLGSSVRRLYEEVRAAGTRDAEAVAAIEQFLLRHWPAHDPNVDRVGQIVEEIESDRTILKVEDVLARHDFTKRSLQRLFEHYVGIGPKWVISRFRMHEVIQRLEKGEPVDWAAFALDLGYFDQAHFNREFKAIVGRTPREYANGE
jgi:AraC-like DNA-binding protein